MGIRYGIYRLKYIYGQHLNLKTPVDLMLELSSSCNQRCGYCFWSNPKTMPFKPGIMSTYLADRMLEQGADMGVNSVKFNFRGEPTMHKNFSNITLKAQELASGSTYIDRIVNSNFNFPTFREDIFRGMCSLTKVKVSFDSFRKEVLETQRKGSNYDKALANIDKLYNYPGRDNTLVIQAVRTDLNKDEDLEGEIKRRWPSAVPSIRDVVSGRTEGVTSFSKRSKDRQPCRQAFVRLVVNHDGIVTPCCPDIGSKLVIGDVNKETLYSIFNNYRAKLLRRRLRTGHAFQKNPCLNCPSYESYKGYKAPWRS